MQGTAAARVRYVPLGERRHGGGGGAGREYAARRAVFLRTYRLPSVDGAEEGLRGRVARRLREAVARARGAAARWCAGRAWRGWRARADPVLVCFGAAAAHHKYHLHDYV